MFPIVAILIDKKGFSKAFNVIEPFPVINIPIPPKFEYGPMLHANLTIPDRIYIQFERREQIQQGIWEYIEK